MYCTTVEIVLFRFMCHYIDLKRTISTVVQYIVDIFIGKILMLLFH